MQKTILLSKYLGVSREDLEHKLVFDAVLGIDTKLFVDPKLLISSDIPEFENVNDTVYQYFKKLLKVHKFSIKSRRLQRIARDMLTVPEPKGVSIGYGDKSDRGTTSISKSVADSILLSASEILAIGVEDEEILELLGLFVEGYGADSISDLMIHISYKNFCEYTQRVSHELGIKTENFTIEDQEYLLPRHPFNDTHIIFVPHVFLRKLPIASSWDEIVNAAAQNSELRVILNSMTAPIFQQIFDDLKNADQKTREAAQKRFNELLSAYTTIVANPYDLHQDNAGYYHLMPFVESQRAEFTVTQKPQNVLGLIDFVRAVLKQYQRSIEDNGANKLLYRKTDSGSLMEDRPHNEDVAQLLFYLISDWMCAQADVALSGESYAGRGPVDFSLATSYREKVLVEIKKSKHTKLIAGYEKQIKVYKKSENAAYCFYVVIDVKKKKSDKEITDLDRLKEYVEKNPIEGVELIVIDGLIHPSPSKL